MTDAELARYAEDYQDDEDNDIDIDTPGYLERKAARDAANQESDRRYAQSAKGQLAAAEADLRYYHHDRIENGIDHSAEEITTRAKIEQLTVQMAAERHADRLAEDAAEDAEWTREVTIERRAAWNALATSGQLNDKRLGRPTAQTLWDQERKQGWNREALKRAIKRHNL